MICRQRADLLKSLSAGTLAELLLERSFAQSEQLCMHQRCSDSLAHWIPNKSVSELADTTSISALKQELMMLHLHDRLQAFKYT